MIPIESLLMVGIYDETNESKLIIANDIFNYECNILDIGDRIGHTGYIDFIQKNEVTDSVMRGVDKFGRKFLVANAEYVYENGSKVPLFFTFFQRYNDNDNLYHCCGHNGKLLFWTDGGSSTNQLKFLRDLLEKGLVYLNKDIVSKMRLTCNENFDDNYEVPFYVQIS